MSLYALAVAWFIVFGVPLSVSATVPITVQIDGQSPITGNDCVTVNGTYGPLTIAGWTGSDARIGTGCAGTSDDDTKNDVLRFLTAVITSSDTNVEHTITISGVYTDPPTATAAGGTQAWYKLSGQGNFKRGGGAASGSTVKAWGYVESPSGSGSWTQIGGTYLSRTIQFTSSFFGTILSQPFPPPDISGNRTLKSVFKFMFKNAGDSLQIDNSNGIVVYSSPSPGEGSAPGVYVPHPGKPCPPDVDCLPCPTGKGSTVPKPKAPKGPKKNVP